MPLAFLLRTLFLLLLVSPLGAYDSNDQRVGPSKHYVELELETFRKKVFLKDSDVLVNIYGDSCGGCQRIAGMLDRVAEKVKRKTSKVKFARYDVNLFGGELPLKKDLLDFYSEPKVREGARGGETGSTLPRIYFVKAGHDKATRIDWDDFETEKRLYNWIKKHASDQSSFETKQKHGKGDKNDL
eukprot:TRINITY_DN24881_c0_g1_i1.p2 TRINITY_DN24881_c0_g1~~TRINITY_DN24881_c0_g1_i1.p2  ORF type:complete len:192 (+),score=40.31 TRINITY_DN24881_c0_g1_i1:23-577(+)